MRARHAVSVAIVVVGAILFLADRVGGGGFSSLSNARLALSPTTTSALSSAQSIAPASSSGGSQAIGQATSRGLPSTQTATFMPSPVASLAASATATPMPPFTPTGTPVATPQANKGRADNPPRQIASAVASRVEPVTRDELWNDLAGFSGRSNQERERYVAEHLFPAAGLTEVRKEGVPYGGSWGPEYGSWDGLNNVIATRRGTLPTASRRKIVLGAHFDKVTYPKRSRTPGQSDGILDNGSGVNIVTKIVQALHAPLNDIEVVAFASEEPEPYFLGSRVYFGNVSEKQRVLFFANYDCLGIGNLALIDNAADPSLSKLAFQVAASEGLPLVWRAASADVASDHLIAQYYGLRVLSFTSDLCDWPKTHNPEDNLTLINKEAYYRHYLASLKIVTYLDYYLAEASSMP